MASHDLYCNGSRVWDVQLAGGSPHWLVGRVGSSVIGYLVGRVTDWCVSDWLFFG